MFPFSIDRHSRISLTDQVAGGLRRAIQSGHYPTGVTLPTLDQTAQFLGVSSNVVQTAIKRLSHEGLVTARPKRGIEVCPVGQHRWQAHVLYLHWGGASSFYEAVSSETVMNRLLARHILVTSGQLNGDEVAAKYPLISSIIHAGPINMAVLAGSAEFVGVFLAENEIPFVHLTGTVMGAPSRLARRVLVEESRPALEKAVQHAAACGVRSLLMMVLNNEGDNGTMRGLAEAAGFSVRMLVAKPADKKDMPAAVQRGGLEGMARWLESGEPLPDLIYFADDYLAQGGLTALLARGIRIPEEVQVISWANRDSGPVFPKALTRVEMDPERDGEALVNLVMEALKKPDRKVSKPLLIGPEFIVGETTRVGG